MNHTDRLKGFNLMSEIKLTINGQEITVPAGTTILQAARTAGIYIPTLCYHPNLPPAKGSAAAAMIYQGAKKIENAKPEEPGKGCGLCVVEIAGQAELAGSCATEACNGMTVITDNERIKAKRRENLIPVLA